MRFLGPEDLRRVDSEALEDLLARAECVIAAGAGELYGLAVAAFLFADYSVIDRNATLHLDAPEAMGAIAWKAGLAASRPDLDGRESLSAAEAYGAGLCDEVIDVVPQVWLDRWKGSRSEAALDAAAVLIRTRGGDERERELFARLFATGEPQSRMRAFLARK